MSPNDGESAGRVHGPEGEQSPGRNPSPAVVPSLSLSPSAQPQSVLLFDGVCNLCNASVQFVLRHERAPTLFFCSLQSARGTALIAVAHLPAAFLESLVLIENGRTFTRSDAALAIARHLRAPWRWARVFRFVPRSWRDGVYDFIARRRYRWFGKDGEICRVPTPELKRRMLA